MRKNEKEQVPGRDYKGFSATRCRQATWHDLHNSHSSISYYRLELNSPCDMTCQENVVQDYTVDTLSDVFEDLQILSHNESNKRAFKKEAGKYIYNCFGVIFEQNWGANKWTVTLFLHENFKGFPMENIVQENMEDKL